MKTIIIGGSAGGASVAARLRRLDESMEIVMFEKSATISFANCGIPYYLSGVIKERDRLNVVEKTEFEKMLNVDVRTNTAVLAIDRAKKSVYVKNLLKGTVTKEAYDKLVLSPGGQPIRPAVEGLDENNVFTLRSAEDTDATKEFIKKNQCKNALVIGAGFIGLEMAENLSHLGMRVNVVDMSEQVMSSWDYEMAVMIHHHLRSKNVNLILNDHVKKVSSKHAELNSGLLIPADLIILAIGVTPDTHLAQQCGLAIGKNGGIKVNDGLITSDADILALGDAVEVKDRITHNQVLIPLAGLAHKQAQIVAENICGNHRIFKDVQVTAIAKVFDLTVAMTGRSERNLIQNKVSFKKSYIEATSHAGYYPDAHPMIIKLLFAAKTGRILGAQIIGVSGVDKRIDVIATAIKFGKTVYDLMDLELAYAPPFSSAKDPVNLAGMVAKNMLKEDYRVIHYDEVDAFCANGALLIDVRTPEEFELRTIEGAVNIPLTEFRAKAKKLPKDKPLLLFCQQGKKSYFAYRTLKQLGYDNVVSLSGGFKMYSLIKQEQGNKGIFDHDQVQKNDEITFTENNKTIHKEADKANGKKRTAKSDTTSDNIIEIDACGLNCPGPILKLNTAIKKAKKGAVVKISATDMGFVGDVKTWANRKGHKLISLDNDNAIYVATLQKCS